MISNRAATHAGRRWQIIAAVAIAVGGLLLFHFFGNATRGYVKTTSLFWWWISQWIDPNAETEHGWLVLAISGWLWWRNVRIADRGLRIADWQIPETGGTKPETGGTKPETGDRKPESSLTIDRAVSETATLSIPDQQSAIGHKPRVSGFRTPVSGFAVALLSALALHLVGFVAQQTRISIVAFLIFTWGVVRLAGGRRWGDAAVFPLAFMAFAIPLSVLDEVGLPLRLWVTTAGETIAGIAGIDILRSGTQLIAPDGRFNYDVAAPCSGVRSLMALTALSVLVGYLNFRSWWRRGLVFALCFPLVYLGNVARIVAIVFAAHAGGAAWGNRTHVVMGYGVFAIVLGGLLLAVAAIHRWWAEAEDADRELRSDKEQSAGEGMSSAAAPIGPMLLASGIVIALIAVEMAFLHRIAHLPPRGGVGVVLATDGLNPVELPAFLGTDWIGQRAEVSAVEREILPPDTGFSRKNYAFVSDRTRDVFLSIVLSGRDRTSIHRPELCLAGQGWTIEGTTQQIFRAVNESTQMAVDDFPATVLRVRREIHSPKGKIVVPQLVAYWFVGSEVVVASNWQRFLHDASNRVLRARSDRWAYVLLQTDARDGEAAALARMQSVLNETLSAFQRPVAAR